MAKIVKAGSTQDKGGPSKSQSSLANPKNAESKQNLSKVFGVEKK